MSPGYHFGRVVY